MVFPAVLSRQGKSGTQVQASIDAAIAAAAVDPLTTLDVSDDFVSGAPVSLQIGALTWAFLGGTASWQAGEASRPGIFRRDTSTTISTTAYTFLRSASNVMVFLASETFDVTWAFRLNVNDANTRLRLGLSSDWSADAPVSAVYLEKKAADASFFGTVRAASTESRTAALASADTAWHKARMRRIDASTVGFTLDANAEATIATNVPTAGVVPGTQLFNVDAASKTLDHDFFRLRLTGLVR